MNNPNILPLALGLVLFSFFITSILIVPFINLLYKIKLTRRKEAPSRKNISLFDKLHDMKAGTPIGGGLLLISIVSILFLLMFPLINFLGIFVASSFRLEDEIIIILFTFISFGLVGFIDDLVKIFGKPHEKSAFGSIFGLSKKQKLFLQLVMATIIASLLHGLLGIRILHIPVLNQVIDLGIFYIPFATLIIVFFANAFNLSDGLDGLSSGLLMIYLFAYVILVTVGQTYLDTPLFVFIALWIGALLAFLYFNVYPARIFMGDAGALSFGAMIAVIGLMVGNVATLFVIGGLFVLEAISSLAQMFWIKFFKRKLLPMAPFHHGLQAIGWEEPKIVMRAWLAAIMLAIFGLWLATI